MPNKFYLSVEAVRQGVFRRESVDDGHSDKIEAFGYSSNLMRPFEASQGTASGRTQHGPVTFWKAWGDSSPQFAQALLDHETLASVSMEFYRRDGTTDVLEHVVVLTSAAVMAVRSYRGAFPWEPGGELRDLEEIALTYRRMETRDVSTGRVVTTDWGSSSDRADHAVREIPVGDTNAMSEHRAPPQAPELNVAMDRQSNQTRESQRTMLYARGTQTGERFLDSQQQSVNHAVRGTSMGDTNAMSEHRAPSQAPELNVAMDRRQSNQTRESQRRMLYARGNQTGERFLDWQQQSVKSDSDQYLAPLNPDSYADPNVYAVLTPSIMQLRGWATLRVYTTKSSSTVHLPDSDHLSFHVDMTRHSVAGNIFADGATFEVVIERAGVYVVQLECDIRQWGITWNNSAIPVLRVRVPGQNLEVEQPNVTLVYPPVPPVPHTVVVAALISTPGDSVWFSFEAGILDVAFRKIRVLTGSS
jgi:type VI secretion system Hcp family effector